MKKNLPIFLVLFSFSIICKAQTGIPIPQMTNCDNLVMNFLNNYQIPGATIALAKDGELKYMRGFGDADIGGTEIVQPYHMFRLASVSKPITSITIMKLMEEGMLNMDDKVFGAGGIFENNVYFNSANITDDRIYDITVQQLLEHSAGWNRNIDCNPDPTSPYPWFFPGCDPIGFPLHVTEVLGEPNPITAPAFVKFLLEKGLDFAPGTDYAYSNIGYTLLGEIVKELSGMEYEDYVKDQILAPLGICDMHVGKTLIEDKRPREGEYPYGFTSLSAYGTGEFVSWAYGGIHIEAMGSHGGWIATARDLVRLTLAVDGFDTKPDILTQATLTNMTTPSANNQFYAKGWAVNPSNNWWHNGSLPGTASFIARTTQGYTWAVILNSRVEGNNANSFWADFDNLPWQCMGSATGFPAHDLLATPSQNSSAISFSDVTSKSVKVNWTSGTGTKRILVVKEENAAEQFPLDGVDYTANADFGQGSSLGDDNYIVYNDLGDQATVTNLEPNTSYQFRLYDYTQNGETGNHALYLLCNSVAVTVTTLLSNVDEVGSDKRVVISPNPVADFTKLSLENEWRGEVEVQVLNILGQVVYESGFDKFDQTIDFQMDLSDLGAGTYSLVVFNEGDSFSKNFVKQ